jgi:hypothetical protein
LRCHPCGYTAVRILAKAMEIAGTATDVTAIKSALRGMKIDDIEDETWFKVNPLSPVDEEGHVYDETGQGMGYYTAIVFSGGELVPLKPLMG